MQVKYRRTTLYGSGNVEGEAYTAQTSGADSLMACKDDPPFFMDRAPNIRLMSHFGMHEALFIVGGRQSIIESLRMQGGRPLIMNYSGSEALYAWFFRKKHTFGKNQALVVICAGKNGMRAGGWDLSDRMDLRSPMGPCNKMGAEVSPAGLADICERVFHG